MPEITQISKIEFARELFRIGGFTASSIQDGYYVICDKIPCSFCKDNNLKDTCTILHDGHAAYLSQEELNEFYETYPEVKIVL